jgi:DNA polymerase III subunit delta'
MMFTQVIGHEFQKDVLSRALSADRLAHAYLFEGPEGIGKRLLAMALARGILCLTRNGCGQCAACRKVDHRNHPDLHVMEAEGATLKIEQVRSLQRELSFSPLEGSKKICLIDGADTLNPAAGNALLKTLEEPPGNALLILLTSRPEAVLGTIRSRCQRLPFARLPREAFERVLVDQLNIEPVQAHILAALSEGNFQKALGKDRDLYLQGRREILKSLTALSPGSVIPLFNLARELSDDKERLQEVLEIFQAFYRDLLLFLHGRPENELVNTDLLEKIHRIGARENIPSLLRKLDAIAAGRRQLDRNVNRQLAMEVLLMRLAA